MRTARASLLAEAAAGTTLSPLLRAADGPAERADAHVPVRSFLDDVRRKTALRKVMGPKDTNPFASEQDDPEAGGADDLATEPEQDTKETVNYRYSGDPAHSCGACRHYQEPGSCEIVAGLIRPVDVCDKFAPDGGGARFGRAVVAEAIPFGQRDDSWGRRRGDDDDAPNVQSRLEPFLDEFPDTTPAGVNPWLQDSPEDTEAETWSDAARAAALASRQGKAKGGRGAPASRPPDAWLMGATQRHERRGLSPRDAAHQAVLDWQDQERMGRAAGTVTAEVWSDAARAAALAARQGKGGAPKNGGGEKSYQPFRVTPPPGLASPKPAAAPAAKATAPKKPPLRQRVRGILKSLAGPPPEMMWNAERVRTVVSEQGWDDFSGDGQDQAATCEDWERDAEGRCPDDPDYDWGTRGEWQADGEGERAPRPVRAVLVGEGGTGSNQYEEKPGGKGEGQTDNARSAARAALRHPRYEDAHKELTRSGFKHSGTTGDERTWAEHHYAHPDGSKITLRYEKGPGGLRRSVVNPDKKTSEVTPPGMEPVVKALKRKPGVDNPWAVAWSQYNTRVPRHEACAR